MGKSEIIIYTIKLLSNNTLGYTFIELSSSELAVINVSALHALQICHK